MKNLIICLLSIAVVLPACKQDKVFSPTRELHNEIMAIHDEVMPRTSEINKMIKKINTLEKGIEPNNTSLLAMLSKITTELKQADEGMMTWMKRYKKPNFKDHSPETINMLNSQMDRIKEVRDNINNSLSRAGQIEERIAKVQNKTLSPNKR